MPAPAIALLGQVAMPLVPHLLRFTHQKLVPAISHVLDDPGGYASRIGDLVLWNGSKGRTILAGLQSLGESQNRIEQAITSIEGTQIAMHASLSSMQMVACATLGVTSLAGGFMLWRLDALNKRFDRLSRQIQDLEDTLDAQNKAHLRNAIQKLREYDSTGDRPTLTTAKNEAQTAANIYGQLTCNEAMAKTPRLEVLNYRGRCYLLALLTELRTRLLEESLGEAVTRFEEERQTIESLARATFTQSIGESPAPFLAESTKEEGISLDVMTEIYQHAQRLGAFTEAEIRNPSDMFEYCRSKGISGRPFIKLPFIHESGQDLSKRLKYLMACFEDIGRVESLKLLADHIKKAAMPFNSLQSELKKWQEKEKSNHSEEAVFAYSFA